MSLQSLSIDNEEKNNSDQKVQFKKLIAYKMRKGKSCQVFEFNTNTTIMFVGRNDLIQVFGFNNKNKLIQTFNNQVQVFCLAWIRKSNSLVSEGKGYSILIWQNYWNTFQKLNGHSGSISVIIVNQIEDLLITGSEDGIIKFWKNINQSWISYQTLDIWDNLSSLDITKLETKLISCARHGNIRVIEYKSNQFWSITQDIIVEDYYKDVVSQMKIHSSSQQQKQDIWIYLTFSQKSNNISKKKEFNLKENLIIIRDLDANSYKKKIYQLQRMVVLQQYFQGIEKVNSYCNKRLNIALISQMENQQIMGNILFFGMLQILKSKCGSSRALNENINFYKATSIYSIFEFQKIFNNTLINGQG